MFHRDDAWEKNLHILSSKAAGRGGPWSQKYRSPSDDLKEEYWYQYGGRAIKMILIMLSLSLLVFLSIFALFILGSFVIGPPSQPVGPYRLVDVQVFEYRLYHFIPCLKHVFIFFSMSHLFPFLCNS